MLRVFMLSLLGGFALSSYAAAPLRFLTPTNTGVSVQLNAAAYDGSSLFLAVGTNSSVSVGSFAGDHIHFARNGGPGGGVSLLSATAGNGTFVVGCAGGAVFTNSNGTTWRAAPRPFPNNSAAINAVGFNPRSPNPRFVAAASAVEIAYSQAALPLSWHPGRITYPAYFESFNAVTPFGLNSYAVCGFAGDILISTDGGANWNTNRLFNLNLPALLGIASDGANRLVAVGEKGTLLYSPNGGASWSSHSPTGASLNAVAYSYGQNLFMAVGNGGLVFTSSDGINWTRLASPTGNNLRGVTFANTNNFAITNQFLGVGMVVGDNGVVFLAGTVPPPPGVVDSNPTYCAGSAPLNPEVTNYITPANWVQTVDWYDVPSGGARLPNGTGTTTFLPPESATNPPPNMGVTNTFFAEARDSRTTFVSTNRVPITLTVLPRPKSTLISDDVTNCNYGLAYTLKASLTGIGPWTVSWSDGFVQTTNAPPGSGVVATHTVFMTNVLDNVPTNFYFWVTAVSNADTCIANQPGDILGTNTLTINPRPTSTLISGNITNCNDGTPYTAQASLTGVGPWTVFWSDGFVQTTNAPLGSTVVAQHTVFPTNSFGANAPRDNSYYVTGVSNADTCLGNGPNDITGTNVVTVNPRPTAVLTAQNRTNCNDGTAFTFTNTLTGIGPWTVVWNDGTIQTSPAAVPGPVTLARMVFPTNTFAANSALDNIYFVTNVMTGNTCIGNEPGDITGTNTITIIPRPTVSLIPFATTNCNDGTAFPLTNTLTGLGPWTIWWNDGVIQTNPATGAGPVNFTRTVHPTNTFGANAKLDNVYYVTNIANLDNCIGSQPGEITGTNIISINPRPTAVLTSLTGTNCNDGTTSYDLTNTLTGFGPWTITWNDGTVQTLNIAAPGPLTISRLVVPTNSFAANAFRDTFYYLTNIVDGNTCHGNQPGDISGTNRFRVNPRPTATLISSHPTTCNDGSSVSFTNVLTGLGPWTVVWNDGTTQVSPGAVPGPVNLARTVFPTNSFAANTPQDNVYYVTNVSNGDGCIGNQAGDIAGTNIATVNPRPTAVLAPFTITNCNDGTSFTLTNTLTGIGPWTLWWNDGTRQTNSTPGPGPVLFTRQVFPTNSLAANAARTNIYYLTNLANGDGCLGSQAADISGTNFIIVNPRPTATLLSFQPFGCNDGTSYPLTNRLTGIGPWIVTWNDGLIQTNPLTTPGPVNFTRAVIPTNTTSYYLTSVMNGDGCTNSQAGEITGTNTITIQADLVVVTPPYDTNACNGGDASFSVVAAGANVHYQWWFGGSPINGETNSVLLLTSVSHSDTVHPYHIVLTSNCGSTTNNATLTLSTNMTLVSGLSNVAACVSGNATFTIDISGTVTNYQWYKGGAPLSTSTSNELDLVNLTAGDAATYSVVAKGGCSGTTTISNFARLTVSPVPAAPVSGGDFTNCVGVTNPALTVTVPTGVSVDWFTNASGGTVLANGTATNSYTPTNTAPGTYTYYAEAYYITNSSCPSTNRTALTLVITNCPLSIVRNGTQIVLSWFGNLQLQTAYYLTNAPGTNTWTNLLNGTSGTVNYYTNQLDQPQQFFRLHVPGSLSSATLSIRKLGGLLVIESLGEDPREWNSTAPSPDVLVIDLARAPHFSAIGTADHNISPLGEPSWPPSTRFNLPDSSGTSPGTRLP